MASVRANVLGFTRDLVVTFVAVDPTTILSLSLDRSQTPADGASLTRLTARVAPELPQQSRTVVFRTSAGEFATHQTDGNAREAAVAADAGNVAVVDLKSPWSRATVRLSATVANVTARQSLQAVRASPDTIIVDADKVTVTRAGGDTVTVTITLTRDSGQVTDGTLVTYHAVGADGATIGSFAGGAVATVDSSDQSEFKRLRTKTKFNPDDGAAVGAARVTVTAGGRSRQLQVDLQ